MLQNWKILWENLENWSYWKLKGRSGWNLNAGVIVVLLKWKGISFHSRKLSSCNRYIREHWRIAIFLFISTFLRPPVAKELHRVPCVILVVEQFKRKLFCIFSISSILFSGTTDVRHMWTLLDKANVFKTILLPKATFHMHHILRMLNVWYCSYKILFSMLSSLLYENWIPRILMVFTFKLTHLIPQTATCSLSET